jgi:hypothetical protein
VPRRLGWVRAADGSAAGCFLNLLEQHTAQTRELFLHLVQREREQSPSGSSSS